MSKYYVLLGKNGYSFQISFETYDYAGASEIGRSIAESLGASFLGVMYAD